MRKRNKRARRKSLRKMASQTDGSIVVIGKNKSPVLVSNMYDNQLDKELDKELDEVLENEK